MFKNLTKRQLGLITLVSILVLIVSGVVIKKTFFPSDVAYVKSGNSHSERIWFDGSAQSSDSKSLTGNTTVNSISVTKNGKETVYDLNESVYLSKFDKMSNSDIIKLAQKSDKQRQSNEYNSELETAKEDVKTAESDAQGDKEDKVSTAKQDLDNAKDDVKNAQEAYQDDQDSLSDAQKALKDDQDNDEDGDRTASIDFDNQDIKSQEKKLKDSKSDLDNANKQLKKAQDDFDKAKNSGTETSELKSAKKHLKSLQSSSFKYKAPKASKISASGKTSGKDVIEEIGANTFVEGEVNKHYYSGYTDTDGSDVFFTKMTNSRQKVVFDKPQDINIEN